jgi:predicted metallopeptidase
MVEADYILYLDKLVFEHISELDKVRVIRHELQHCDVDFEKKAPYGIRDHEITDFFEEIQKNADDPRWCERVDTIAESLYDKEESGEPVEEEKEEN